MMAAIADVEAVRRAEEADLYEAELQQAHTLETALFDKLVGIESEKIMKQVKERWVC